MILKNKLHLLLQLIKEHLFKIMLYNERAFCYYVRKNKCLPKIGDTEGCSVKKKYRIRSRARFTLFMTVAILIIISITGTVIGANNAESLTKPVYSEIVIQSGDTLWNLAKEFGPDGKDIREVVYEICRINDISADSIYPGQTILIPVYI